MNRIKFLSFFSIVALVLLFCTTMEAAPATDLPRQEKELVSGDSIHYAAVLQPQADHLSIGAKNDTIALKWLAANYSLSVDFVSAKAIKAIVFSQDIDRCENVSLLLFPFHIFW